MAEVDFSNAIIEPADLSSWKTPIYYENLSLNRGSGFYNSAGNMITNNLSFGGRTQIVNKQKQMVWQYQGNFTDSGTEFYLRQDGGTPLAGWRVYNISFNNGDTFLFTINAELICN